MTTSYMLSGRQLKELTVRGSQIIIALPAPWDASRDPLEFARVSLPRYSDSVVRAEWGRVCVAANSRSEGLAGVLGNIKPIDQPPTGWYVVIQVALVTLCGTPRPRHRKPQPQWPANVQVGDWRLVEDRQ